MFSKNVNFYILHCRSQTVKNLSPTRYCDPLADRSVYFTLFPRGAYYEQFEDPSTYSLTIDVCQYFFYILKESCDLYLIFIFLTQFKRHKMIRHQKLTRKIETRLTEFSIVLGVLHWLQRPWMIHQCLKVF